MSVLCSWPVIKISIFKTHLNVRVDNQFREPKNFSAKVKSVSESGFLSLFCRERFDRLQVEVVVQVKVVQVLSVNQQVEHVVALTTYLKADLNPIEACRLEKLGRLERPEIKKSRT